MDTGAIMQRTRNHGLSRGPQLANYKFTGKYWTLS